MPRREVPEGMPSVPGSGARRSAGADQYRPLVRQTASSTPDAPRRRRRTTDQHAEGAQLPMPTGQPPSPAACAPPGLGRQRPRALNALPARRYAGHPTGGDADRVGTSGRDGGADAGRRRRPTRPESSAARLLPTPAACAPPGAPFPRPVADTAPARGSGRAGADRPAGHAACASAASPGQDVGGPLEASLQCRFRRQDGQCADRHRHLGGQPRTRLPSHRRDGELSPSRSSAVVRRTHVPAASRRGGIPRSRPVSASALTLSELGPQSAVCEGCHRRGA